MYSSSYGNTSSALHDRKYTSFAGASSPAITRPSHEGLLDQLVSKANEDERKLKPLLDAFDLEHCFNDIKAESSHSLFSNPQIQNQGRLCGLSTPEGFQPAQDMDNLLISDEIRDKYDYLSTPIRRRYFPKLSPHLLRVIMSTPPTRASTPNNTSLACGQHISAGSSTRCATIMDPFISPATETHSAVTIGAESSANLSLGGPCNEASYHVSCSGLSMLPLTPPPSSKLPGLESFPSLAGDASRDSVPEAIRAPLPGSCYHPNLVTPKDFVDHLKAAVPESNSSLFVTPDRRDIDADLYSASGRDTIHLTAALRQHSHGELSSAALRNFQRVISELQGSESEAFDRSRLDAASPQPTSVPRPPGDHASDRKIPKHVMDVSEDCDSMNYSSSTLDPATIEDCTSSSDIGHRTADISSLDQEFASLLLDRAFEDDLFASRLILLARRFERMAMQRRQLAVTAVSKTS